jgi:hypothetical protein
MSQDNSSPTVQIAPIQNWPYWVYFSVTAPAGTQMQAVQNYISLDQGGGSYTANTQVRTQTTGYSFWLYIGNDAASANDAGKPLYAGVLGSINGTIFSSPVVTLPGHAWGNTAERPATKRSDVAPDGAE